MSNHYNLAILFLGVAVGDALNSNKEGLCEMNFIKQWFEKRKVREFQNGYEFAAGVLLKKGRDQIHELLALANNPFDYPNDFDKGVRAAIFDYQRLIGRDE